MFVNPALRRRLEVAERAASAVRGDVTTLRRATLAQNKAVLTAIAGLHSEPRASIARLSRQLPALPSSSTLADDVATIDVRLNKQFTALQDALTRDMAGERSYEAHYRSARIANTSAVEAAVAALHKTVVAAEGRLDARIDTVSTALGRQINGMKVESHDRAECLPATTDFQSDPMSQQPGSRVHN